MEGRSPANTAMAARAATAEAFRRHPASTTAPAPATASVTVAPFGEASSRRVPAGMPSSETGEREDGPGPPGPRTAAP